MSKTVESVEKGQLWLRPGHIVPLLVLLQVLMVFSIWSLGAVNEGTDEQFALYLAANLVSFAMISYLYRVDNVNRGLLLAGVCMVLLSVLLIVFGESLGIF